MATTTATTPKLTCAICGKPFHPGELLPFGSLHGPLRDAFSRAYPNLTDQSYICMLDLSRFRQSYVEDNIKAEQGELTSMQQEVLQSIKDNESLIKNINSEFDDKLSFGDRLADKVAEFGGSWRFIITFGSILFVWITMNSVALLLRFDPFPFILLNLVLSCVAALQAPVIMMSQNRQEAKDRLRAEQDFRTNLKAELEVRNLNAKMDELLTHQWQRLLEIQQIQMDMMEEMTSHHQWVRDNLPATSSAAQADVSA